MPTQGSIPGCAAALGVAAEEPNRRCRASALGHGSRGGGGPRQGAHPSALCKRRSRARGRGRGRRGGARERGRGSDSRQGGAGAGARLRVGVDGSGGISRMISAAAATRTRLASARPEASPARRAGLASALHPAFGPARTLHQLA
jgi:hypothetical protein